jgi:hypothetical protein
MINFQHPMSALTIRTLPRNLRRPILITAFSGWNDAAESATTAARYLASTYQAEKFAEIDPEEFYHFGMTRGRSCGRSPSSPWSGRPSCRATW